MENCKNLRNDFCESTCIKCRKPLNNAWRYCPYCTTVQKMNCQHCGKELKADWKFCPHCQWKAGSSETSETLEEGNEWLRTMLKKE